MLESVAALMGSVVLVALTALTGGLFRPDNWYRALRKPDWTPPNRVFPIAWAVLYLLMAIAAWRVYLAEPSAARDAGLVLYLIHLIFNAAWSWLFFGRRRMVAALVDILLLWMLLSLVILLFFQASVPAAILLVPYWFWVAFAALLNARLWKLNPAASST
ncbi:tryptophan-rich sensory protein [Guyparkeria hydrothermalis]|uniref:TspO/MBR family protein n=1 Tax=Guyparkeria hydrothermalis TaxID=923 RepID=UPI0020222103|nr:TspO/MBR family protein [Guyparkeria hydrothermalis]MCL7744013.1 tryptophan-rich sensory protein [Guyparkeria hydrothermalis]